MKEEKSVGGLGRDRPLLSCPSCRHNSSEIGANGNSTELELSLLLFTDIFEEINVFCLVFCSSPLVFSLWWSPRAFEKGEKSH